MAAKPRIQLTTSDVHLCVDPTKTFGPDGQLPVTDGDKIVGPIKSNVIPNFDHNLVIVEIHPYGHVSLASTIRSTIRGRTWEPGWLHLEQILQREVTMAPHALLTLDELREYVLRNEGQRIRLWPDHSLMGDPKTSLLEGLERGMFSYEFHKGMDPKVDSYSAFRDVLRQSTGLTAMLDTIQTRRVFISGLAFDFCVGWTAIDAVIDGFEAYIIEDATRAVNIPANGDYIGSVATMRKDLERFGVRMITSDQLVR